MVSKHLLEAGFITSWAASELYFTAFYICAENKQHPTALTYTVRKLERVAHVLLLTCYDGIVILGLSGAPIMLTSLVLGGPNSVRDALLIVFTLAGRSLPGHAVKQEVSLAPFLQEEQLGWSQAGRRGQQVT